MKTGSWICSRSRRTRITKSPPFFKKIYMDAAPVKAIIFDLGNVLVSFDHSIAARKIAPFTDKTLPEIYSLFFNSNITQLFEEGKIAPLDFFAEVKRMLGARLDYDAFLPIWNEIFFLTDENRRVYALAKRLNHRYATALLSNINILHLEYLKSNFSVFDAFGNVFTSCELGSIKPDPSTYNEVLRSLGVMASEAFYVDDRQELIDAAAGLGIRSFVFMGAQQLEKDLSDCGVIVE